MGSLQELSSALRESLITELANSLKTSKLLIPASEGYAEKVKRWADSAEKQAGAIMLATSATDISTTLLLCQKHSIDLATRGGGHSTSGAASSEGGIVIDLSEMRNVTVNPVDKTITAQGGCLWEDVDKAAGQHGLATVGGTVNHTGIGGLTLGGGYGWLCGQYGLTVDNLLSVEIVLANGDVVRSSESENTDLFWGIRGAGQSLGVVTEFIYRAHDQPNPVWAGQLLFSPDKLESVIEFGNHIAAVSKGEAATIMGFCAPPPVHAPLVFAIVFYNGTEEQALEFFKPLLDASPVVKMVSMIPYRSVNSLYNTIASHGGRKVNKGSAYAHPVRPTFFRSLYDDFSTFLTEVPDAAGSMLSFEIYATDKICQVSNTAMAFANRGSYRNNVILLQWGQKENDAACRAWARVMAEKFKGEMERGKREGDVRLLVEGVGEYLNGDGLGQSAKVLFGQNYERLVELKGKYDPGNVFAKSHLGASLVKGKV